MQTEKEEVKLTQFPEDLTLHIEKPKDFTRKWLVMINSVKLKDTRGTYEKSSISVYQ